MALAMTFPDALASAQYLANKLRRALLVEPTGRQDNSYIVSEITAVGRPGVTIIWPERTDSHAA